MESTDDFSEITDTYGVPIYHVTDVVPEDSGDGNVRVWNCYKRNGVLIPQFACILHPMRLFYAMRKVGSFAERTFNMQKIEGTTPLRISH